MVAQEGQGCRGTWLPPMDAKRPLYQSQPDYPMKIRVFRKRYTDFFMYVRIELKTPPHNQRMRRCLIINLKGVQGIGEAENSYCLFAKRQESTQLRFRLQQYKNQIIRLRKMAGAGNWKHRYSLADGNHHQYALNIARSQQYVGIILVKLAELGDQVTVLMADCIADAQCAGDTRRGLTGALNGMIHAFENRACLAQKT